VEQDDKLGQCGISRLLFSVRGHLYTKQKLQDRTAIKNNSSLARSQRYIRIGPLSGNGFVAAKYNVVVDCFQHCIVCLVS